MIPVLNLQQRVSDPEGFAVALGQATRDTGFFLVAGHEISQDLIDQVFDATDQFFALPVQSKNALSILNKPHNRGWSGVGTEHLDDSSEMMDRKEAFNIGLDMAADDPRVLAGDPFRGVNLWPEIPGFRGVMLDYFAAVLDLGRDLHKAFACDLGLRQDYFDAAFTAPLATLRLLHYPPATGAKNEIGAGAHTDYGSITLLMTDGEPGLQVRPRGCDWIDVPHVPGAFVVNIADCLMRWTNDVYVSTPHRVLPPVNVRRSLAFFLDPNPEAVITPLPGTGPAKYQPVTGADYLRQRLQATYEGLPT